MSVCLHCSIIKDTYTVCPFENGDVFGNNFRCGLVKRIRKICDVAIEGRAPARMTGFRLGEQSVAMIDLCKLADDGVTDDFIGLCLWATWYKRRGSTDAILVLSDDKPARAPNRSELEIIAEYYEKLLKLQHEGN